MGRFRSQKGGSKISKMENEEKGGDWEAHEEDEAPLGKIPPYAPD